MDFEKDLFDQLNEENGGEPYDLRPECILVDKVFDACFQRECEPSKIINLQCGDGFNDEKVVFGPGYIVDGTLTITPVRENFARVRFVFHVPFTVTVIDRKKKEKIAVSDCVEFTKDIEVFLPQAPDEFAFQIVIETRAEVLQSQIVGGQLILSIGVFVIVKVVGHVQMLVQAFGYCPPPRECVEFTPEDVCELFEQRPLPDFFPPQLEDLNLNG